MYRNWRSQPRIDAIETVAEGCGVAIGFHRFRTRMRMVAATCLAGRSLARKRPGEPYHNDRFCGVIRMKPAVELPAAPLLRGRFERRRRFGQSHRAATGAGTGQAGSDSALLRK